MEKQAFSILKKRYFDEKGITALETAIILIAFIVGASVFAFTILQAGTFSTERGKESVLAGLNEVQSTIELQGQIISLANTTGMTGTIDSLAFTVVNVLEGSAIPLNDSDSGADKIVIQYFDETQRNPELSWTVNWLVNDGDNMLENGEIAEISITNLDTQLANPLSTNTRFTLELLPAWGSKLTLVRTTPPIIDQANTLN